MRQVGHTLEVKLILMFNWIAENMDLNYMTIFMGGLHAVDILQLQILEFILSKISQLLLMVEYLLLLEKT